MNTTTKRDQQIEAIARTILDIPTLEARNSDQLDFHEVAVWQVREALRKAYMAGYEAAISDLEPDGGETSANRPA